MGEHAFLSNVSQPISAVSSINNSREQKLARAAQWQQSFTQGIYESIEAYHERMKQFQEERLKRLDAENTKTAEKKYNDIMNKYLTQSTDVSAMEKGLGDLQSLFRFAQFNKINKSFDDNLYLAKKQQNVLSNRLYKIKNGQEEDSGRTSNPMLYSGDFQEEGKRDFLS